MTYCSKNFIWFTLQEKSVLCYEEGDMESVRKIADVKMRLLHESVRFSDSTVAMLEELGIKLVDL